MTLKIGTGAIWRLFCRVAERARGRRIRRALYGMGPRRSASLASAVLLLLVWLPMVGAPQHVIRHSGKVERVDIDEGLVVVDELAEKGQRRRHEFHVGPETPIVSAGRLPPWQVRGSRAYEEIPVSLVDLLAGDFVVVDSTIERGRAVALRITIVEAAASRRPVQ
ncbi:MAG: hypothetical protein ACRELA_20100 [Candidatus Rokuibacteriota bacterium]